MDGDLAAPEYAGPLDGGLVRRWSTPADTERIADLIGRVFRHEGDPDPHPRGIRWGRLLMSHPDFPFMGPGDVAVVEDTSAQGRPLVACTTFWRHTFSFDGIPFGVTRPEMVGVLPQHRRRGLVRALLEMIHARGEAEGHMMAAITGIEYFYRQFGYEYVFDLEPSSSVSLTEIPDREGDEPEPYTLRPATAEDVPALRALYEAQRDGSLVWHEAPEAAWRFAIAAWDDPQVQGAGPGENPLDGRYLMIDGPGGTVGSVWTEAFRRGSSLRVTELHLDPKADAPAVIPSTLRLLRELARDVPGNRPDTPPCTGLDLVVPPGHVLYRVVSPSVTSQSGPVYAWYIRVPDLVAFLRLISPALDRRLADSPFARHSGSVLVNLYRSGIELRIEDGRVASVEPWQAPVGERDVHTVASPPLTVLQLVLGYRSLEQLRHVHPDVSVKDGCEGLVDTLFPRVPTVLEPLG